MKNCKLSGIAVVISVLSIGAATAASGLDGAWSGGGYVVPKSGARESVRCRVRYSKQSAKVFSVSATCDGANTHVVQTGEVLEVGSGRYTGDFYNPQFDISGRVRVQLSGNKQSVSFSGAQGQGALSLTRQ